jgi:hypothetical protein
VNRGPEAWLPPLVALAVLLAAGTQIVGALRVTGAFGWQTDTVPVAVPPAYEAVNQALDRHDPRLAIASVRDPFTARAPVTPPAPKRAAHAAAPVVPPPPAVPILTAIVWDSDPRALVHWKDREWTVREGGLFDEFQVVSITRDQVSLRRGDATLVLQRRNPGD